MSVCAVMLVKDEADVIEHTIEHLYEQVDQIIVADNGSTDGTFEILDAFRRDGWVELHSDDEKGYWQSRKTTALARLALDAGHQWVVPCDADEVWYCPDERVGDFLDSLERDVQIVRAELFNHFPTGEDDQSETDPLRRLVWRHREPGALPKVAARASEDLVIEAGNHGAHYGRRHGPKVTIPGLVIRHFSWRSELQYLRKIRNGQAAYAETDLPASIGAHWRAFDGAPDEAIVEHFHRWFWIQEPRSDESLILDPAPVSYAVDGWTPSR